ncbi:MAG: 3,4-dihydroxy-2-butanone-4-phosphate synthase [Candidatus Anstonellales archaeon]
MQHYLKDFVMLFDSKDRENEIDLCIPAEKVTWKHIYLMRKHAGGLICLAIDKDISLKINLPFITELLRKYSTGQKLPFQVYEKTKYGDSPAFSVSINHKSCYTGITDRERAHTIRRFYELCIHKKFNNMKHEFLMPGHVILLRSRGVDKRHGHTELSIEVCKKKGYFPLCVISEMLDSNGKRLSLAKAKNFAKKYGIDLYDCYS